MERKKTVTSDLERQRKQYTQLFKPKGCPLRRTEPKGPIKGCEETCKDFEACVELNKREKVYDEWLVKELERLDKLGRETP